MYAQMPLLAEKGPEELALAEELSMVCPEGVWGGMNQGYIILSYNTDDEHHFTIVDPPC